MRAESARRAHRLLTDAALDSEPDPDWVGLRLLEDGDRRDLRGWISTRGEGEPGRVFSRQGRRLSRRARAFWSLVLEGQLITPAAHPLWPEA